MLIPYEEIAKKILVIRGKRVMLDRDLASLYQVETKVLIQAVKRNKKRFPEDFMFQLKKEEFDNLRSHSVTSKKRGGRRYRPYVFTEQGVAMLSSVLNSKRAIMVNIVIMRTFVQLRKILASHQDLLKKIEKMEKKYDSQFKVIFEVITKLMAEEEKPKKKIGFYNK